MTKREKILAGVLGAAVGLFATQQLVKWAIVRPLHNVQQQVKAAQARRDELRRMIKDAPAVHTQWQAQAARALASDPYVAEREFRQEVATLLAQHQLTHDLSIKALTLRPHPSFVGFVEVPLSVRMRGTLEHLVGFLKDFYEKPYFARVARMTISAESTPLASNAGAPAPSGRRGRATPSAARAQPGGEPQLDITLYVTTLVLPKLKDLKLDPNFDLDEEGQSRLALAETPEVYAEIARTNVFRKYVPPPPPTPPSAVEAPPAVVEGPQTPVTPPPPPDPTRDHMTVIGTTAYNGDYVVYVRDDRNRAEPPQEYRLNDALDGGTIVFVHALGAVVHIGGQDWFYRLGGTFSRRELLDASQHADIARELRLARES